MIVQGQIKGLKKGTLYLQKMADTVLVSVDSIALNGSDTFTLTDNVASPVLYYLTFDGNTTDKRILFFGEQGIITINDEIDQFGNQGPVIVEQSKEERDAKTPKVYLGNAKVIWTNGQNVEAAPRQESNGQMQQARQPMAMVDDLPF